jgi:hypothetical protein
MVADVVTALLPFLDVSAMSDGEILCHILSFEFGSVVVDRITREMCSAKELRHLRGKEHRSTLK